MTQKSSTARALLFEMVAAIRDHTGAHEVRIGDDWKTIRLTWRGQEYDVQIRPVRRAQDK